MKWIELIVVLASYYQGYVFYSKGNQEYTVVCALICAITFSVLVKNLWSDRYVHMSLKKIDKLEGRAFEDYLIVQFRRLGYRVKKTEASNDYGADLILKKRRECIVVQAKRYDYGVGISAVQEVVGSIAYYGADRAMVVTNRYFTRNAKRLAAQNDVELWDREMIKKKFRIH